MSRHITGSGRGVHDKRRLDDPGAPSQLPESGGDARAGAGNERHYHRRSEEIYVVLEGNGTLGFDGEIREVEPGDAALIPPGAWHQIRAAVPPASSVAVLSSLFAPRHFWVAGQQAGPRARVYMDHRVTLGRPAIIGAWGTTPVAWSF